MSYLIFIILLVFAVVFSIVAALLRGIFGLFSFGKKEDRPKGKTGFPWENGPFARRTPSDRRKEGEVSIDYVPPRQDMRNARPSYGAKEDEYVDFEEVKDPESSRTAEKEPKE